MKRVAILGSTGSVGRQALDVVRCSEGLLGVHSLVCFGNLDRLLQQAMEFRPEVTAILSPTGREPGWVSTGPASIREAVEGADLVLNAISGSAGLDASLLCQELGLQLALANKESLVVGGELLHAHLTSGSVIPVDSEHSTIHRCMAGEGIRPLGITLTASGGALRDLPLEEAAAATAEVVLRHPTWSMGARITVDSASLVNKAFEVIEARWLFPGIPVSTVVHPQSVVHSLLRLADGSFKAILGTPDMRIPIQYALLGRKTEPLLVAEDSPLDWPKLDFLQVDPDRFPAFALVCEAGERGEGLPSAANGADEVAVEAFLGGRILFGAIPLVIERVLDDFRPRTIREPADVFEADREARLKARAIVEDLA